MCIIVCLYQYYYMFNILTHNRFLFKKNSITVHKLLLSFLFSRSALDILIPVHVHSIMWLKITTLHILGFCLVHLMHGDVALLPRDSLWSQLPMALRLLRDTGHVLHTSIDAVKSSSVRWLDDSIWKTNDII